MRFNRSLYIYIFLLLCFAKSVSAQSGSWPVVKAETRPWTRWWWMGNAVDKKNLSLSLSAFKSAGLGGVEIAPIYGVKGYESRYIDYLSPAWMDMLNHTTEQAKVLKMGVDLTNGTGWPFGGPQVTPEYAASKLIVQTYELGGSETLKEKIKVAEAKQENAVLQFLTAYNDQGAVLQLKDKVKEDGTLNWTAPSGQWTLYAAFLGKTRQMVKRSSPGGEGYTLNHFSSAALHKYLERFDNAFNGKPIGVRAVYNDSYEVYGADWSEEFLSLFEKNRGYDFRKFIREFVSKEGSEQQARLKSDYRETMSEMLLQNFTSPWTSWAHARRSLTRNQAHGSPGNLLDLYAAVDIPECETFGSSYFPIPGLRRDSADIRNVDPDPVMLKFASSAAHVTGKKLTSSETFTWLTEHFKTSLSQCKPEVEQVFLSGVNHVFFHGTTYSPAEAKWPGWLFYASVNFVPANSWWSHLPGLTSYITRVQSVLQAGRSDNEILIYWPVYDAWNKAAGRDMPLKVHDIDEWLHPTPFYKDVTELQRLGYSLDFISDHLLQNAVVSGKSINTAAGASPYRVLVVPQAELMPLGTLQKVLKLAEDGATVIVQALPKDVPGLGKLEERRKQFSSLLSSVKSADGDGNIREIKRGAGRLIFSSDVPGALSFAGVNRERLTDTGLKFIRRQDGNTKYYYLVNHTEQPVSGKIPLNAGAASVLILDPQTGDYGKARFSRSKNGTEVELQILPGESLILRTSPAALTSVRDWHYLNQEMPAKQLSGPWKLQFTEGGPAIPADKDLPVLKEWTALSDTSCSNFSGRAVYSTSFDLTKREGYEYLLDLGKVSESAHVWINGKDAGILWSIPYRTRIGKFLQPGKNTIKIEVANLMANRIRYMDRNRIEWKIFKDVNLVDINYKPFDASNWKVMPSGLAGPVKIIPYKF